MYFFYLLIRENFSHAYIFIVHNGNLERVLGQGEC